VLMSPVTVHGALEGCRLPKVTVLVRLKATLDDAQGRVVARALRDLGFGSVQQVRIGKLVEIWLDDTVPPERSPTASRRNVPPLAGKSVTDEFRGAP
jgi:Phosphoribosylformylglycinamidine (FGAM) synthase, PurS component